MRRRHTSQIRSGEFSSRNQCRDSTRNPTRWRADYDCSGFKSVAPQPRGVRRRSMSSPELDESQTVGVSAHVIAVRRKVRQWFFSHCRDSLEQQNAWGGFTCVFCPISFGTLRVFLWIPASQRWRRGGSLGQAARNFGGGEFLGGCDGLFLSPRRHLCD
jgi:hypothetical protein